MTNAADAQFLSDWSDMRKPGRRRYALQRGAVSALFPVWGGVNLAVRPPQNPDLLFWTLVCAAALGLIVFFASDYAFNANEKRFAALVRKGAVVPPAPPQKASGAPRYAIFIGLGVAAIIPIAFPLVMMALRR